MFSIGISPTTGKFFLMWRNKRWDQDEMDTIREAKSRLAHFEKRYPNDCFDLLVDNEPTERKHLGWRWSFPDGTTNTISGFSLAECKKMLRRKLQRNKKLPRGTTWEKYYG